ncbi:MAG TPA: hypothetical protein PLS19_08550 [bacterium]|nr:hypothetical protein [bacterium]HPN94598.1 hypothetical protein [bacterium]
MRRENSDIFETKSGGGGLALFGSAFLAAGIFIMSTAFGADNEAPWYFVLPFGLIFATVGAGLVFGRSGVRIDRLRRSIVKWQGLIVPMRSQKLSLDAFRKVTLTHESRGDSDSRTVVYPVRLKGEGKTADVEIASPQSYERARAKAEELAKFTRFPLEDSTSGTVVTRASDALALSIRETAAQEGEDIQVPPAPQEMKSSASFGPGGSVSVEIPARRAGRASLLIALPPLAFSAFVFFSFFLSFLRDTSDGMPAAARIGIAAFIIVIFVALPPLAALAAILSGAKKNVRVTASVTGLVVETSGLFSKSKTELKAEDIEEFELAGAAREGSPSSMEEAINLAASESSYAARFGRGIRPGARRIRNSRAEKILFAILKTFAPFESYIVARTDARAVSFGRGLERDEVRYVHAILKKALVG